DVMDLLSRDRDVDLLIPRGGKDFVSAISRQSRIPVLGHGEGICHVYVHSAAALDKAERIIFDAKLAYAAACTSAETILVAPAIAHDFLPRTIERRRAAHVELRGCPRTIALALPSSVTAAVERDWSTKYGDLILSIKIVDDLSDAIAHIHQYGSGH